MAIRLRMVGIQCHLHHLQGRQPRGPQGLLRLRRQRTAQDHQEAREQHRRHRHPRLGRSRRGLPLFLPHLGAAAPCRPSGRVPADAGQQHRSGRGHRGPAQRVRRDRIRIRRRQPGLEDVHPRPALHLRVHLHRRVDRRGRVQHLADEDRGQAPRPCRRDLLSQRGGAGDPQALPTEEQRRHGSQDLVSGVPALPERRRVTDHPFRRGLGDQPRLLQRVEAGTR